MPLLEVTQKKKVVATITLEEPIAERVDKYAAFINGNADDVVCEALDYVFNKDKDFQRYLENPDERKPLQGLRIKRPVVPEIRPKRGRPFRGVNQ